MKLEELKDINAPISPSMINCGLRCQRRFLYRYRWGLVPKISPYAPSPRVGKLFHRLLELGPAEVETVRKEVAEEQKVLMERIRKGEDLTGDLTRTAQDLSDLFHKALVMAEIFWHKFKQPDDLETVACELTIKVRHRDTPKRHIWKGRLDRLVRNKSTGEYWIRDIKTTAQSLNLVLTGYAWSTACRFYRLITDLWLKENEESYKKGKLRGIILDICRTPTIKYCPTTKDKEGFNRYLKRVEQWYDGQEDLAMIAKGIVFTEPIYPLELRAALQRIDDYLLQPMIPETFERDITRSYCKEYNRVCPYYDLCVSDMRGWPSIIEREFDILEVNENDEGTVDTDDGVGTGDSSGL